MQFIKFLACPVLVFALTGCGSAHKLQTIDPGVTGHTRLSFLKDSQTTKKEVLLNLGTLSVQFEEGRILTYRLDGKYQAVPRPSGQSPTPWHRAQYSLVLVFDAAGILQRHSLVRVR